MPRLVLDWPVDKDGYRVERTGGSWRVDFDGQGRRAHIAVQESGPVRRFATRKEAEQFAHKTNQAITIAHGGVMTWIAANGGEIEKRECFAADGLWRRLAGIENAEDARLFANKHGLPYDVRRWPLDSFLRSATVMRWLIAARDRGDKAALDQWVTENRKVLRLELATVDGEMLFAPATLLAAAYVQFFEDGDAPMRLCKRPGCGEWFKYGPGTKHRETAEYCTPKCQKAHTYAKTKERKHGKRR